MTAPTVEVRTPDGKTNGSIELPAEIFDAQANIALMHQVVVAQLAAARQGTHAAKTRGQVSGGGAKPYRQKGTGRARQGSTRAPQFAGGGVVHGPQPRKYNQRTPKKMKAAALRGALSDRARDGRVHVITHLVEGDTPSTKSALAAVTSASQAKHVLVVLDPADVVGWKSLRNSPSVHLLDSGQLNTYDVLVNDDVVFTQAALESFLAGGKKQLPDLSTHLSPGGVPSVAPAVGEGTVETTSGTGAAPAKATAKAPSTEDQPYGAGSHAALEDGGQPEGFPIKGNASSKLYHVPGSSHYERTAAEVWFATTEDAEKAGFQLPKSQRQAADEEGQK